ncbi:helix-turn-helix transcriptional regulator [Pararhodobacter sp. SW119]|uniref:helix-turn-helix transcriptional regulator n=1 Tax=Pararhodobacter sp. SW119 TaxID=2780075 RepID=UPI001AE07F0E|nr:helix-turn-helix transcriptional regulator [Pararhodobacter sp. SW119]
MPRSSLSGTRIRALRKARNLAQAELARLTGISPSYLNLIEHNKRRPGPALLTAIAGALNIPEQTLARGAEDELVEVLRAAAAMAAPGILPELDRLEEFVGRFPGWAGQLGALTQRVAAQERAIERFSDRMAHDPNLSAALHEIVSAVTAVQSTAAILVETEELDADWRGKFHANIHADSQRMARAAEALVAYLDTSGEETGLAAPLEELESWLARHDHRIEAVEKSAAPDFHALTRGEAELASQAAREMARAWLAEAHADARALPLARLVAALRATLDGGQGFDPERLARDLGVPLVRLFRRLATLPEGSGLPRFGLVECDGSGTLTRRRPIEGLTLPRFGGACPVWPLYQALVSPLRPLSALVEFPGRPAPRFLAFALAEPSVPAGFAPPVVLRASMLLTPATPATLGETPAALPHLYVGSNCRICPRLDCIARREPSIVAG